MKLAFAQSTKDLRTLFAESTNVGYDGLQLKGNQFQPHLNEPQWFLDQHGNKSGAASALITGWSHNDEQTEHLRQVFAFGAAVGTEANDSGLKLSLHHYSGRPVMHSSSRKVRHQRHR